MLLAGGNRPKRKDDVVEFRLAEADFAWFRAENQSQQMILIVEGLYIGPEISGFGTIQISGESRNSRFV
jgi:hypothetical protein